MSRRCVWHPPQEWKWKLKSQSKKSKFKEEKNGTPPIWADDTCVTDHMLKSFTAHDEHGEDEDGGNEFGDDDYHDRQDWHS